MEFAFLFLVFAACLWAASRGSVRQASVLFTIGILLTVAFYLHLARETLPLSF